MIEVLGTDEFADWYGDLSEQDQASVEHIVGLLEERGLRLGSPYSSEIKGASFALRELRKQSGGRPLRIFYAFDPLRAAVLLIGGDKTGEGRFYERMIPLAEKIWRSYLSEQGGQQ
jgi:hypothetical protein